METYALNKYNQLKRSIYLLIIPLFMMTNILYWLVSPNINRFMEITVPPICVLLMLLWIGFYKKIYVYYLEIFCVLFTSVYQLIRVQTMAQELAVDHLNVYMFWSPIYYILVFIVLERNKALYMSLTMLGAIMILTWPLAGTVRAHDIFIQYYVSTLIYIIVVFFFRTIVSAYLGSAMLVKNAYYDYLTNIGNRRSIDYWLDDALEHQQPFSIIYFDIDHFKKINDVYGHDVGDQVLKEIAVLVSNALTPSDDFGRWGGEEFLIVARQRPLQDAVALAKTLRQQIDLHSFQHVEHITSSFGVTTSTAGDSSKSLLKRADEALYIAKNSGRNLVVYYDAAMPETEHYIETT